MHLSKSKRETVNLSKLWPEVKDDVSVSVYNLYQMNRRTRVRQDTNYRGHCAEGRRKSVLYAGSLWKSKTFLKNNRQKVERK